MHGQVIWAVVAVVVLAGCSSAHKPPADMPEPGDEPTDSWRLSSDAEAALVRPGLGIQGYVNGTLSLTQGYGCTAGFLARSVTNGTIYLATAGHCVESYSLGGPFPIGFDGDQERHSGRVVYVSQWSDPTVDQEMCMGEDGVFFPDERRCFNDLALVELSQDTLAVANASLPMWGGPVSGLGEAVPGSVVYTVGASYVRGGALPAARAGALLQAGQWSAIVQFSTTTPVGDSGSPVLDAAGHALGLVVARAPNPPDPIVGTTAIGLLAPMLDAAKETGWHVEVISGGAFFPPAPSGTGT